MTHRSGILAGGNWIVDKLKLIDTYPQQDALANILDEKIGNGGSPFNILLDLANLGAKFPLAAVGLIGNDADGQWVVNQCVQKNVNTDQLTKSSLSHTSYTYVMMAQKTARRTFFHQRGVNALLDDPHFNFESSSARIFHLGYLLLLDRLDQPDNDFGTVAARVLQRATLAGLKTSIDLVSEDSDRFKKIVLPALPHVDYCFLNEFEIERTTGILVRQNDKIDHVALKAAAEILIQAGVREWVVVHFPEGACAVSRNGQLRMQGSLCVPLSRIRGTVGAGDAFAAGVLYGLHEGCDMESALIYGVCVAAACLCEAGCSDGVRPLEECLMLKNEFGVRSGF